MAKLILLVIVFCLLFVPSHSAVAFAWVHEDGTVVYQGGFSVTVTKIDDGHYCFTGIWNYATMVVTLQTGATNPPTPGYALANSGWGDLCNPYGGPAVHTYNETWGPEDRPFSIIIYQ